MVQVWSGREVRALRESQRLSIREFAARIGVSERMVSRWEAGGERIRPRPINQEGLDSLLAGASDEARTRFAARLEAAEQEIPAPTAAAALEHRPGATLARRRTQDPDVLAMRSFRSADLPICRSAVDTCMAQS
ncbi:helix-turn-helix domain-containing protein [Kribbella sp. NBC_01505]|uniref:helix-turn-helix domain-containing protein n=1 Tax=Kribbella sp. NBC_01505 TaxID=2903580 RepID=UPI00386DCF6B